MVDDVFLGLLEAINNLFDGHEYSQRGLIGSHQLVSDQLESNLMQCWMHVVSLRLVLEIQVLHHFAGIDVLLRQMVSCKLFTWVSEHILFLKNTHFTDPSRNCGRLGWEA